MTSAAVHKKERHCQQTEAKQEQLNVAIRTIVAGLHGQTSKQVCRCSGFVISRRSRPAEVLLGSGLSKANGCSSRACLGLVPQEKKIFVTTIGECSVFGTEQA